MESSASLKIGQLAAKLGITVRTIRYYQEQGLLEPVVTDGGTRLFNQKHVERLKAVLALSESGFSIKTIQELAQIRPNSVNGHQSSEAVRSYLDKLEQILDNNLLKMQQLKLDIDQARNKVKQCKGCDKQPSTHGCPDCPLISALSQPGMLHLIWDEDSI